MIWPYALVALIVFIIGFFIGYRYRAKYDSTAWELVARYKLENDQMIERLVDLENAMMEVER